MIKQMSLIALGAATLFMAPTVVHANDTDTLTKKSRYATVTLKDEDAPNELVSVPDFKFNPLSNQSDSATDLISDGELQVKINKSHKGWGVMASKGSLIRSADIFGKTEYVNHEELILDSNEVEIESPGLNTKPVYLDSKTTDELTSTPINILTASGHSVGEHTLKLPKGSVKLSIPKYYPAGSYLSVITWQMGNLP